MRLVSAGRSPLLLRPGRPGGAGLAGERPPPRPCGEGRSSEAPVRDGGVSSGRRPVNRLCSRNPFLYCPKVFAVVLVMQLDCVEALECGLGEYPIGAECCLMCAAGLRVFKHCTANSSTMCVPCVEDTYTDHPNGLEHCRKCKLCDKGTKTTDNVCEACPPGTSSTANMSHSCIPWSKLKKNGWVQGENGNSSSASSVTVIVCSVVVAVLVIAVGLTSIWKWRKRKNYVPPVQESRSEQQSQALILTVEHTDQTTVPVQETGAGPEETSIE